MDVKSSDAVPAFEEMLTKGPMAVVLVYADWCGHCDNYKKNVWSPLKSVKNRTVNMATLREDVIQNTSLKNAKIDGYPSVLVVGKDKKPAVFNSNSGVTNAMPESNDVSTMKSLITSSVPKEVSAQTSNSALTSNSTAVSLNSEYPTLNVSEDTTNSESMNSMNSMNSTSTTSTNSSSLNSENTLNFPKSVTPTALNTEPPSINEDEITLDETTSDETTSVPRSVTPRTSSMPTSTPRTATANSQGSTPILRGGRLFRKLSMKHRKSNKNTRKNKKTSKRKN